MKVIIAGSRTITDYQIVKQAIAQSGFEITTVVSGGARGPDQLGERYAKEHDIPIEQYIPDWTPDGKNLDRSAGLKRNIEMAKNADAVVAIWDGESRGTMHMIAHAAKLGLKIFVHSL